MKHEYVAVVFVVVLAPVFGGVTATLGTSAADTGARTSPADAAPTDVALQDAANNTTLTFENQTTDGTLVTVSQVTLTEGGFVVIHDRSLLNGSVLGSVLGSSTYLEAGTHENVTVTLDEPITESQPLLALAYQDTDDDQTFDFVSSQGQEDGPYTVDNQVVADDALVTVEAPPETTTPAVEETTTPVVETTTPVVETTTPAVEETTTPAEETTTTEEIAPETTTPAVETTTPAEETTTTEEVVEETTTEEVVEETTTPAVEETTTVGQPVEERLFIFRVDSLRVEDLSFVVGPGEPDRTVVVEDRTFSGESVAVDVTALLSGASVEESLDSDATETVGAADLQTVRVVVRNVTVDDVTFVVTAPEGVSARLEEAMPETTTEAVPGTTTTEEVVPETTTTAEVVEEETTTTEEVVPETTTTEEVVAEETTTPAEPTTEARPSLRVAGISAPDRVVLDDGRLVVEANLRNPSDVTVTDTVQLRIDGTVVEQQNVKVEPGETLQVQFSVAESELGLEPGESFLGVLTRDFGKTVDVTVVDESEASETTTAEG